MQHFFHDSISAFITARDSGSEGFEIVIKANIITIIQNYSDGLINHCYTCNPLRHINQPQIEPFKICESENFLMKNIKLSKVMEDSWGDLELSNWIYISLRIRQGYFWQSIETLCFINIICYRDSPNDFGPVYCLHTVQNMTHPTASFVF